MKIRDVISSRLWLIFPEISEKFPEILNFRKNYNPNDNDVDGLPDISYPNLFVPRRFVPDASLTLTPTLIPSLTLNTNINI